MAEVEWESKRQRLGTVNHLSMTPVIRHRLQNIFYILQPKKAAICCVATCAQTLHNSHDFGHKGPSRNVTLALLNKADTPHPQITFRHFLDTPLPLITPLCSTSSHHKVSVHWMPRPCVPKQWDLGQKLRCLWKAWSMVFHALKVVKWALMTPSGHKLTKCKKCQVLTHKKWQK